MGGYSHSRMREAMFGGFTRRVLLAPRLAGADGALRREFGT